MRSYGGLEGSESSRQTTLLFEISLEQLGKNDSLISIECTRFEFATNDQRHYRKSILSIAIPCQESADFELDQR